MSDSFEKLFSKNLKFLREQVKDETQQELADCLDVEYSSISNYEHNSIPKISILMKIRDHYANEGVSIDSLLFDDIESIYNSENRLFKNFTKRKSLAYGEDDYHAFVNRKYHAYYYNTNSDYEPQIASFTVEIEDNKNDKKYDVNMILRGSSKSYYGNLILTNYHIYIYFQGRDHSERGIITLPKPPNDAIRNYIGGLGIISSISSGMNKVPCSQKIFITTQEVNDINKYFNKLDELLQISNDKHIFRVDLEEDHKAFKMIKEISNENEMLNLA